MSGPWRYGTVVRVDPATNPKVPQPDDRRWMVVAPADAYCTRPWTLMFIDDLSTPNSVIISYWSSMHGFCRADDE